LYGWIIVFECNMTLSEPDLGTGLNYSVRPVHFSARPGPGNLISRPGLACTVNPLIFRSNPARSVPARFPAEIPGSLRPVSLTLHQLDLHYHIFKLKSPIPDHYRSNQYNIKPVKGRRSIHAQIFEYLTIVNSESMF